MKVPILSPQSEGNITPRDLMKIGFFTFYIITVVHLRPMLATDPNCNWDLSDYLRCNNPIVKKHLSIQKAEMIFPLNMEIAQWIF